MSAALARDSDRSFACPQGAAPCGQVIEKTYGLQNTVADLGKL